MPSPLLSTVVSCLLLSGVSASPLIHSGSRVLSTRHGDEHATVNDTLLSQESDVSYFLYDYYSQNSTAVLPQDAPRHGGLMLFHGLVMVANYMILLPIIIVLRNRRHRMTWILQTAFWALNLLGWSAGRAYRLGTPDLYPGSTHGKSGAALIILSAFVTATDIIPKALNLLSSQPTLGSSGPSQWARKLRLLVSRSKPASFPLNDPEYIPIADSVERHDSDLASSSTPVDQGDNEDEIDMLNSAIKTRAQHTPPISSSTTVWSKSDTYFTKTRRHVRHSLGSDHSTLHDELPSTPVIPEPRRTIRQRLASIARNLVMILERSLVPYAWGQTLSGLVVYFGLGRTYYINGVLAHFIKGSIFWWYGILTFSRYLGAWRRWGWAWNSPPPSTTLAPWSAAFVESLVIFLYGFTQQFMERFGTKPGDPYSAKDIEHISIAVMFWAGGLVGMGIESPSVRKWLVGETGQRHARHRRKTSLSPILADPAEKKVESRASNPLPAVVVGITGLAMSAHHQTYQFQVQIHALWGYLLLGFAICRSITCFLEWVRRPDGRTQRLPGMPPTELIGSVFLGAGGIAFICSDEEITVWAMKTHRDDVMMFLNLSIAFTCVAYVWVTAVLLLAGKTKRSSHRS